MPRTTIRSEDITAAQVKTADMAVDPTNASNLTSGSVPLAQLGNAPATDVTGLQDDIALLGFKVAANGSFGKYNLVDQTIDAFEDATGVNAGASTDAIRHANNYYSGGNDTSPTGGTVTTYTSGATTYSVNTFLTSGNLVVGDTRNVTALIVGGGGQGGGLAAGAGTYGFGGGGGGAVLYRTGYSITAATYSMVIGEGGNEASSTPESGLDTTGFGVTATGGGGGQTVEGAQGQSGANGGGAGYSFSGGTGTAPSATGWTVYAGNNGSAGYNGNAHGGGGGGGAGGVGTAGTASLGGAGGSGQQITIGGNSYYWGAGGAGSVQGGAGGGTAGVAGVGGAGGAGAATGGTASVGDTGNSINNGATGIVATGANGGAAGANTGSGGGGKYGYGGSGIVIVESVQNITGADMTLTSTTTAANTAPTKGDIVMTYTNGSGTAAINTDFTAEVSADGGSTWTAFTLAAEGSTGTHFIVSAHNTTITSTITAPYNMAYRIKTLNQGAAKETRIQGVSLGWS